MCRNSETEMYRFETENFIITASIQPDSDVDLSFDETGETRENLNSGLWESFGTIVRVMTRDGIELGCDSLWGSIYEKPADFFTEHYGLAAKSRADGCNYGSYFTGMISEAIKDARKTLHSMPKVKP